MEIWFVLWAVFAILCAVVAGNKNRSAVGWLFVGLAIGVIGLMIVVCLPKLEQQSTGDGGASDGMRCLYFGSG